MFGYQPEFDLGENETLYGAIGYDDERRPLKEIVRPTYFDGSDWFRVTSNSWNSSIIASRDDRKEGARRRSIFPPCRGAIDQVADD